MRSAESLQVCSPNRLLFSSRAVEQGLIRSVIMNALQRRRIAGVLYSVPAALFDPLRVYCIVAVQCQSLCVVMFCSIHELHFSGLPFCPADLV